MRLKDFHKIVFFIGPSGSGKDTFFYQTLKNYQIKPIILLTTRPKRDGEMEGREYYFINQERMDLLEKRNQLIERRNYNTQYGLWSYATGKQQILLESHSYLTPNTWEGYEKFLKCYSKEVLVPIYFELDDGIRLTRCLEREKQPENRNYAEMCRRFLADSIDFTKEKIEIHKPFIVENNGSKEATLEQIDNILVRKLGIEPQKKQK